MPASEAGPVPGFVFCSVPGEVLQPGELMPLPGQKALGLKTCRGTFPGMCRGKLPGTLLKTLRSRLYALLYSLPCSLAWEPGKPGKPGKLQKRQKRSLLSLQDACVARLQHCCLFWRWQGHP